VRTTLIPYIARFLAHWICRDEEDDETMQWEQEQIRRGGQSKQASADRTPVKPTYRAAPSAYSAPFFSQRKLSFF
jgi:hypothetical protein